MSVELIVATFENSETEAVAFLQRLRKLREEKALEVERATAVTYPADGKVQVENLSGKESKRGGLYGAVTGGLLGLVGGPLVAVAGAVAGAAAGSALTDVTDHGVSDDLIDSVKRGLQPGSSILIVYAQPEWAAVAIRRAEEAGATVTHEPLDMPAEPPHRSSG